MIHNEKCDNCLCRTVCYFTFPGHELTEKDGECGHFISAKDIVLPAIKEFAEKLKEKSEYFWEEKESFVSEEDIDNLVKEKMREE